MNKVDNMKSNQCEQLGFAVTSNNFTMAQIVNRTISALNFKLLVNDLVLNSNCLLPEVSAGKHTELFEHCARYVNSVGNIKESRLDDIVELVEDIETIEGVRVDIELVDNEGVSLLYDLGYLIARYFRVNW
tara:strand:- start:122 stop:514 length:393 start_codon:yes stop_codon:yes gene_type:complete